MLPEEYLAESREGFESLPLTLLRQAPPERKVLGPGDTLGIYIEGVLGDAESPPPVNLTDAPDQPLSIGYPFPVRQDGTISLPYVGAIKVSDLTIEEAEKKIVDVYLAKKIVRGEDYRILVTLMRPRHVRVLVVRDDSQQRQYSLQSESLLGLGTTQTRIGGAGQGTGLVLELPAYQNDVLNALTRSGGLPGLESTQEVVIQRGYWDQQADPTGALRLTPNPGKHGDPNRRRVVRIPMRTRGGPLPFSPEDVLLEDGDIVTVKARQPEFYYTDGLIPAQEIPLPNDYDVTVLEAVIKARAPLFNGAINISNLNGAVVGAGLGNPTPSLLAVLRKTANGGQVTIRVDLNQAAIDPRENILVKSGDVLLLQESADESVARYFSSVLRFNVFGQFLQRNHATGTASITGP